MAPGGGIEPPLTDSKSAVLPLDDPGLPGKRRARRARPLDNLGYGAVTYGSVSS
jgi:hypothetical protein